MIQTSVFDSHGNMGGILKKAIHSHEPIHVCTDEGNAVILNEADYRGLLETLDIVAIPTMKEKLLDGLHTPLEECVSADKVEW